MRLSTLKSSVSHAAARIQKPIAAKPQAVMGNIKSAAAAAIIAASLISSPVQAADLRTLADVMRPTFEFVDSDKNGLVTMDELQQLSSKVSNEEGMAKPSDAQLEFTLRLFDLNGDQTLTTDEMLTSLALDAVVTEESIDSDAMKVFDRNGDGLTERSDWSAPFGDMGASGENVKGYIFDRVDRLNDGDGKLDTAELVNALGLVRTIALGY